MGPRVKLPSCKSAFNPSVLYSIARSKAVVPVLVLLFVALLFILQSEMFYVLPCVILFLCFITFYSILKNILNVRKISCQMGASVGD